MSKLLVKLHIPAIQETYEMFVPDDAKISELMPVLRESATVISDHQYSVSGEECICMNEIEQPLEPDRTLAVYGLRNGDELWLI